MPHAELSELLAQSRRPAVLTGAGMSAESGIATFRDALTGLWQRFNAEELARPEAFRRDPELVWGWYEWRRMGVLRAQPNPGHLALERLGKRFPNLPIITQNVDDLHERAGSTQVRHLHGSLHQPRCASCGTGYSLAVGIPSEPEGGAAWRRPAATAAVVWCAPAWSGSGKPCRNPPGAKRNRRSGTAICCWWWVRRESCGRRRGCRCGPNRGAPASSRSTPMPVPWIRWRTLTLDTRPALWSGS